MLINIIPCRQSGLTRCMSYELMGFGSESIGTVLISAKERLKPNQCPHIFQRVNATQSVVNPWVEFAFDQKEGAMVLIIRTSAIEQAIRKQHH